MTKVVLSDADWLVTSDFHTMPFGMHKIKGEVRRGERQEGGEEGEKERKREKEERDRREVNTTCAHAVFL